MIPAGPLRQPVAQGLGRANAVLIVGDGGPDLEGFAGPVLRVRLQAAGEQLRGKRVFAFAGIGRPEKFTASLARRRERSLPERDSFPITIPYRAGEIAALRCAATNAQLITTEKDLVRIAPNSAPGWRYCRCARSSSTNRRLWKLATPMTPRHGLARRLPWHFPHWLQPETALRRRGGDILRLHGVVPRAGAGCGLGAGRLDRPPRLLPPAARQNRPRQPPRGLSGKIGGGDIDAILTADVGQSGPRGGGISASGKVRHRPDRASASWTAPAR